MKKLRLLLFTCITLLSFHAFSQCNEYYPLRDGLEWGYESYNAKGKLQSKQHQKVTAFESSGNGFNATVQMEITDDKGKDITKGELEMICKDGVFYFDMRKFIPEEQLKALGDMEVQVEADNLEYPSGLSVGKTLKDGSVTMTATSSAMPMKIKVDIIDRKVEAMETITTPAGTFETFKITSKSIMKNQMGITMTFEYDNVEWLAKEVGVVKNEIFRKGKSTGYTLLVKRN